MKPVGSGGRVQERQNERKINIVHEKASRRLANLKLLRHIKVNSKNVGFRVHKCMLGATIVITRPGG